MARSARGPSRFEDHEYPQVIPVPDDVKRGGPAPWAHLDTNAKTNLTLQLVTRCLHDRGRTFDVSRMPDVSSDLDGISEANRELITRTSAVLVALFEEEGETHIVLTRRSFSLRSHRGEVAFPGGRSDLDEAPVDTALREAHEEVGLDRSLVTPVGWLTPIITFASGSAIWPVVGVLTQRPTLVADPAEVERVFTTPLSALLEDGAFLEERWRRERRPGGDEEGYLPIYFYRVPGDVIWGATARVLTELLCCVTGVEWPEARGIGL
ncbi:MAG: CoA pyrophosphatase [Acidobacteria bacterium]|nr:CoA pyrophosphatase [Acidobacteriota bacterium]